MSKDNVAKAVLGQLPAALAETVSLATPFTMSRIEGRDEAVDQLLRHGDVDRCREDVVRRLRGVDVVVWVHVRTEIASGE